MTDYRILNKIIFINVASFEYEEVELNGNTCFVGTNNLGKTTILRAILFFYNAHQRGLGISLSHQKGGGLPSSSKKTFEKFYFQNNPSYIIYEVATPNGNFHILLYRDKELFYRFIDSEYKREFYVSPDNKIFEFDEIINNFNVHTPKIRFTNQVESFEQYRSIIYGTDKQNQRYHLLKSKIRDGKKMYDNIWKAITNIFLSSTTDIDANFVKQFIADAVSDNTAVIKLDQIKTRLLKFNQKIIDIQTFQRDNFGKKYSEQIIDKNEIIQTTKHQIDITINQIASSKKYSEIRNADLDVEIENKQIAIGKIEQTKSNIETTHKTEITKIIEEIGKWKNKIKEADAKQKEYDNIENFDAILKIDAKKEMINEEYQLKVAKYNSLTAPLHDINQRFETLFNNLRSEQNNFNTQIEKQGLELDKKLHENKRQVETAFDNDKKEFENQQKQEIKETENKLSELKVNKNSFVFRKKSIEEQFYFKENFAVIEKKIQEISASNDEKSKIQSIKEEQILSAKNQIASVTKQYKTEIERTKDNYNAKIQTLKDDISEIEKRQKNYDNSIYNYLEENMSDWKNTIGKVCKNEILFDYTDIEKKVSAINSNIYGLEIDLKKLPEFQHTIEFYEKRKKLFTIEINELETKKVNEIGDIEKRRDNELRKFQTQIKENEKDIRFIKYETQVNTQNIDKLKVEQRELSEKAEKTRKNDLLVLANDVIEVDKEIEQLSKIIETVSENYAVKIKKRIAIKNSEIKQLETHYKIEIENLNSLKEEKTNYFAQQSGLIKQQQKKAFTENNIDTKIIEETKQHIEELKEIQRKINQNAELVANYKRDKKELFDKVADFKFEKKKQDELKAEIEQKHKQKIEKYDAEITEIKNINNSLATEKTQLQISLQRFYEIETEFAKYKFVFDSAQAVKHEKTLSNLIDEWYRQKDKLKDTFVKLKMDIDNFISRFKPTNHFDFKLPDERQEQDYEKFAVFLNNFVIQNRLDQSITELATQFTMIVNNIASKVTDLESSTFAINRIVKQLENDFSKAEFDDAKLIEYIKIKAIPNEDNKVLKRLQEIKKYKDDNYDFYDNLTFDFTGKNKLAETSIELIINLISAIEETKTEEIALVDLFNIYFKIKEGQNETDWTEKLKDIGSDGTDILVKSIVFITLLHVFIKQSKSTSTQQIKIHCIIDEVGKISASYLKELINFANQRDIFLINGLPNESKLERSYNYTYKLTKEENNTVSINPLLTHFIEV